MSSEELDKELNEIIDFNLKDKPKKGDWFYSSVESYLKTGKIDSSFRSSLRFIAKSFAKKVIEQIPESKDCPNCGFNPKNHKEDTTEKQCQK